MFSINCEVQDKLQCLQEGAVDYITKPFIVDGDLLSRIERLLESSDAEVSRPRVQPREREMKPPRIPDERADLYRRAT